MSGPSYRLETTRSRPAHLNLHHEDSSYRSTSAFNGRPHSPPFLYDLPSSMTISPPTSPKSNRSLISPTSPTFPHSRSGRPTPPPGGRNRSTTPARVAQSDLEQFAEYCKQWYFKQDEESGRLMTQTMATLPQSQRAPYSRLQASIRSAYHRSVNTRKAAEFRAHLSATQPGGSLLPHSRSNPRSPVARKERYERFERFIRNWCTMGMPGPQPLFRGLWALMRLQVVPETLGGAGGNRIEWEIDDAVFKESAGKEFMLEAIDILKGVLAFEEVSSSKGSSLPNSDRGYYTPTVVHSRSQSQPLSSDKKPLVIAPVVQPKRARAPSDPFLDTPAMSRSVGSSSSHSSANTSTLLTTVTFEDEPSSPVSTYIDDPVSSRRSDFLHEDPEEEHLRLWTSADLSNPEYLDLLKVFPSFITRQTLPRFPNNPPQDPDLEAGYASDGQRIRFGTGTMWLSSKPRMDGWQGGWWTIFILWLRRTFC